MRHLALQWLCAHWPSQCWVCQRWPAQPLCDDCSARFAQPRLRCTRCALPLAAATHEGLCGACLRQPPLVQQCTVAVDYAYPWALLLQRWKFDDHPALTRHIGRWLAADALQQALHGVETTIPVPMSPQRLAERGYHQTLLLARAWQAPNIQAHALVRSRHTPAQSQHTRAQRLRNLRGVFEVPRAACSHVEGRHVLLVDDIITTGATLQMAAQALLGAGAASVRVLAVARTPGPGQ